MTKMKFTSCLSVIAVLTGSLIGSTSTAGATPVDGAPPTKDVTYTLPDDPTAPSPTRTKQRLTVSKDGWIHYPSLLAKAGIAPSAAKGSTGTVKGTRSGAGCRLSYTGTWKPTQGEIFVEEIAFRPQTCESRIRITRVTQSQVGAISRASRGAPSKPATATSATAGKSATPTVAPAGAVHTYLAHNKTLWIDPINITISSQAANLKWKSSKTLVSKRVDRYGFVGKIVNIPVDSTRLVSSGTSTSVVTLTANATFQNTDFARWVTTILGAPGWIACGFPRSPLATFKFTNVITGSTSAKFTYSWSDSKSGACTNLVHHGQNVGPGWVS